VERSWDRVAGPIEPKSRSGKRRVPLTQTLRGELVAHRLRQEPTGCDLVFATRGGRPFDPPTLISRARRAWHRECLAAIGFHECRHTYASFMIAAGISPKALSSYMGHASITITLDRYGHLLPGNEAEAAAMLEQLITPPLRESRHAAP
jgi:integrase